MISTSNLLFRYLPLRISKAIHSLPTEIFDSLNEIRIRKNSPVSVTAKGKNIFFDTSGIICNIGSCMCATESELNECISKLTDGSLYTCDEYMSQGFIPLPEGGRAGICGKADYIAGTMRGFTEIYSVNIRVHRFLPYEARPLMQEFITNGIKSTLVCSPPAMGKTTFLRSIAYLLATGAGMPPLRVGIADERAELSAGMLNSGITDVISGLPKSEAITMLTRTMAPQVIICDEIAATEIAAVLESHNTGVTLIASAHCANPKELLKRGRLKALLEDGMFPLCAVLGYNGGYTCEISETEVFL